jgi:O-antigen/teichoic acid export membrane protein
MSDRDGESRGGFADAAVAFAIRVLGAGLVFVLQVLLARLMDLDGYGNYVTLWTWLMVVGNFGAFGFAESSVRFLPRYRARAREDRVHEFWRFGFRTVIAGSLALGVVAIAVSRLAGDAATPALIALYVGLALPFLAVEVYLEGVARSFGWFRLTIVPVYVLRPLLVGGACLALHFSGTAMTLALVGAVVVAATAAISCGLALVIARRLGPKPGAAAEPARRRLWLRAAAPLLLVSCLDDLLTYADVIILGLMLRPEDVAVYFAAARTLALANFVFYAMYFVSGRGFALALAGADRDRLQARVLEASRLTFWLTLAAVGITLAAGRPLLGAFGTAFLDGWPVMLVLAAGLVAKALAGQAGEVLVVTGRQRENIALGAGVLAANVAFTVALVPALGVVGAAAGTALAMALRALALVLIVRRTAGLRIVALGLPALGIRAA